MTPETMLRRKRNNGICMMSLNQELKNELHRQLKKWGVQNHHPHKWLVILMEEVGEASEASLEYLNWSNYRKEMLHVAAVALTAINCLDRGAFEKGGNDDSIRLYQKGGNDETQYIEKNECLQGRSRG